ncbi:MAG: 3-phosphoshikimate 1-carboxyvinyltransferase [Clostridia bacterium]|nr:3-phosphoshikimate 1-carboxyvinyltransferase [Clostridia bacterium]
MTVRIEKGKAYGAVSAPPSKSFAHRYLIAAALSGEGGVVHGVSESHDMKATLGCVSALGIAYQKEGDTVLIKGQKEGGCFVFPCLESGSTLRFFLPLALTLGESALFTGTPRLFERGVSVYEDVLTPKGITFHKESASLRVEGKLTAGEYTLRGDVSSQFISGLFFALPLLVGDSVLTVLPPVESRSYIDITLDALKTFGISIEETEENRFFIRGKQAYTPKEVYTEGDWSNAAFLYGLNTLGGRVTVEGMKQDSIQGDRVFLSLLEELERPSPILDLRDCPDLGPLLFALASVKNGGVFKGVGRLKIKESDRVGVMQQELEKIGAVSRQEEDTFTVFPSAVHAPTLPFCSHNDHRIAMSLSLLATCFGGEIEGAEAVGKSYPDFFEVLEQLHIKVTKNA